MNSVFLTVDYIIICQQLLQDTCGVGQEFLGHCVVLRVLVLRLRETRLIQKVEFCPRVSHEDRRVRRNDELGVVLNQLMDAAKYCKLAGR